MKWTVHIIQIAPLSFDSIFIRSRLVNKRQVKTIHRSSETDLWWKSGNFWIVSKKKALSTHQLLCRRKSKKNKRRTFSPNSSYHSHINNKNEWISPDNVVVFRFAVCNSTFYHGHSSLYLNGTTSILRKEEWK